MGKSLTDLNSLLTVKELELDAVINNNANEITVIFLNRGMATINHSGARFYYFMNEKEVLIIPPNNVARIISLFEQSSGYMLKCDLTALREQCSNNGFSFQVNHFTEAIFDLPNSLRYFNYQVSEELWFSLRAVINDMKNFKQPVWIFAFLRFLSYSLTTPYSVQKPLIFNKRDLDTITYAMKCVRERYATVTLSDLADDTGYTPNYISVLLRKATGRSFKQMITLRKMTLAKIWVVDRRMSCEEAATQLGYKNYSTFYRAFAKQFGCSPRKYSSQ